MPGKHCLAAFAALVSLLLLAAAVQQAAASQPPQLKNARVTPGTGDDSTDFLFTVTYYDPDNQTPAFMRLYIDQTAYDMTPVDPLDSNFTDGRDYYYRRGLSSGTYAFYYKCSDGENQTQTLAQTLPVESTSIFQMEHSDLIRVALAMTPVAVALFAVLLWQMRKIGRGIDRLAPPAERPGRSDADGGASGEKDEVATPPLPSGEPAEGGRKIGE